MNYRVLVDGKLEEFKALAPEYTFSQTILAILKSMEGFKDFKKTDLLSMTDEDFYTAAENALKKETVKFKKYQ